jgi:hypothetical protein
VEEVESVPENVLDLWRRVGDPGRTIVGNCDLRGRVDPIGLIDGPAILFECDIEFELDSRSSTISVSGASMAKPPCSGSLRSLKGA